MASTESRCIPVAADVTIRAVVRRGGSEVPFLFVHGLASNARLWGDVAELLAGHGHDSVAVDQRGHGLSSQVDDGFDFATLSLDLAEVIAVTMSPPVIAVGQSWGGNVVVELAARHPSLVAGLGLIDGGFIRLRDTFTGWDEARAALTPPSFGGFTAAALESTMRRRLHDFPESAVSAQLANFDLDGEAVRARLSLGNHLTILQELWNHDPDVVAENLRAMPVDIIAVNGAGGAKRDRVLAFAERSGARVKWVDGAHDVHAQQPDYVAEVLWLLAREVAQ